MNAFFPLLALVLCLPATASAAKAAKKALVAAPSTANHQGDVTDVRVVRRVDQHPDAWRVWQPFIIQGEKKRQLIVAFGAMTNGKKDMGDLLACLSTDDGDNWGEPVYVYSHHVRQGAIQFAYANPVLYRVPGQDVVWCFAMRCPIVQENSEESQLVAAFTADSGRSWTPIELAMHYTGPLITNAGIKNSYPTLMEVAPGDFRAVWHSGTADTPRTHIHFGKFRFKP